MSNGHIRQPMIFPSFVIPVLNWLQIALFIQEAGIILRRRSKYDYKNNIIFFYTREQRITRTCPTNSRRTYFSSHRSQVHEEEDSNNKDLPKHRKVHHSLFSIIQFGGNSELAFSLYGLALPTQHWFLWERNSDFHIYHPVSSSAETLRFTFSRSTLYIYGNEPG